MISPFRAAALVAAMLVACSSSEPSIEDPFAYDVPLEQGSPWPKFRRDAKQTGRTAYRPASERGRLWTFKTGKGIFSSPIVGADGTVYVGSADRHFYALNSDGTERWKVLTGEIIDSAGLLDDQGRVYFGSGDGFARALDAKTGAEVWRFQAEAPEAVQAYINWFEGNVAMLADGTMLFPNDNYMIYALDRATGKLRWKFRSGDQNWSLPAVDVAAGLMFLGNNNVTKLFGDNTFAVDFAGNKRWSAFAPGTIAASPLVSGEGNVVVGGFDGFVRAYPKLSGDQAWNFGARDHIYASAAQLSDGTLVQPAADGTVYGIDPRDGAVRWAFDASEALRSSPAVDGDDVSYVGSGEGRLFAINRDGTLRWAIRLVSDPRNDLNASPALGIDAIYIASESGEIFSVPYDYCLHGAGLADERCTRGPGEDLPRGGAHLLFTTHFGAALTTPPSAVNANDTLAFSLFVRQAGDTRLALIDSSSVQITASPSTDVTVIVSGERRFLTVEPKRRFAADASGKLTLRIRGNYLVNPSRSGLLFEGGEKGGTFDQTFSFALVQPDGTPFPLPMPAGAGADTAAWELSRLAAPLPTVLPSYNQIGFDSLHFLVTLIEPSVAWMVGAKLAEGENRTVFDPDTKAMFPLGVDYDGGLMTLESQGGLRLQVMNVELGFKTFRVAARLTGEGDGVEPPRLHVTLVCEDLGFFATFVRELGFCNPQTDLLSAYGAFNLHRFGGGTLKAPTGIGAVALTVAGGKVQASLTGSALKAGEHVVGIALVDAATDLPVSLDYGVDTAKAAGPNGVLTGVSLTYDLAKVPTQVRAHLVVDGVSVAKTLLTMK